jgi:integrase
MATENPTTPTATKKLPPGIYRRTDGTGKTRYQVKVRLKGHPQQSETFDRLTDAKRWKTQTEAAIRERRHFKTVEAQKHTLADLVARYIQDILPTKPKSADSQEPHLRFWARELGPYTLADVTPAMIAEVRDKLLKTTGRRGGILTPTTVSRYLASLSHAFTVAVKEWGWVEDNPLRKVTFPKLPRGRVRFLSDEERERLLSACRESTDPMLYPVVILALSTGMRAGEVLGLTWDRVDTKQGRILLEETKNGERRLVALRGHALEVMTDYAKVRRLGTDMVFPGRRNPKQPANVRRAWVEALERAGVGDFRFHDLRHSAASYLAMNGATLAEIAEVLGHKSLAMTRRYAHLSEAHTAAVVERMNAAIFGEGGQ